MTRKIKKYLQIIVGIFITATVYNLFLAPYNLVNGDVSGIAIIARRFFYINESVFILVGNLLILLLSFYFLDWPKTKHSILGSLLFPLCVYLTTDIKNFIVITDLDPLLVAIIGGALNGFGNGLIFQNDYTTGGTDILEQLLVKFAKMPFSKAIIYIDGAIIVLSGLVYGMETLLYSLIVLILSSELTHRTMFKINRHQLLFVQSKKINKIKEYLQTQYVYDVTLLNTIGGYTQKKRKTLFCAVEKKDYYPIKEGILLIDPHAFITFVKAYETQNGNHTLRHNQEKLTLDEDKC